MGSHDPRVDTYIAKSAEFARPILEHIRATVHAACPEVEETLKWSMPSFVYKGAILCGMAAFKQHASLHFWHHKALFGDGAQDEPGKAPAKEGPEKEGMGQFGKLASVRDLPPKKTLAALLKKAAALIDDGATRARPKAAPKPPPSVPEDLAALLAQKKHAAARKHFEGFSPSAQREYVEWIIEAKTDATRQKRLATALEWLAEGKHRNWKYQ
ncbi:YdeI/OmpD-associated family protein [Dyella sp. BiH032]|uniref:YdeI/OmpD-associated family protein n=1 Tax=Dyella sp. BiH032 TaxID=3075430 RepID=UPI002892C2A4|nr:YdeI/OmpD-associated family protein [Dyella sp. BiH032]WNL45043.1 YdeI/OmpD-associated family protein [Dyella sp. BiH032]